MIYLMYVHRFRGTPQETVEAYSYEANIKDSEVISKEEFEDFIAAHCSVPLQPGRNLPGEIDAILQRLAAAGIP